MRLWRVLPWDASASEREPGGVLWFPRELQGGGRHDRPDRYGCLYVSEEPAAAIAEALAPFRNAGALLPGMLTRAGLQLALAALDLGGGAELVDLDEPRVLVSERLRPSVAATRRRSATQAYAERLYERHPAAAGLRWWSTLDSAWLNVTLFDRAAGGLMGGEVTILSASQPAVAEAATFLGLG